jgi:hypothetical protein
MSRDAHASNKGGFDSSGGDSSERRHATVLFADLAGFTAFSERRREEAAYSLIQHLSALSRAESEASTLDHHQASAISNKHGIDRAEKGHEIAAGGAPQYAF